MWSANTPSTIFSWASPSTAPAGSVSEASIVCMCNEPCECCRRKKPKDYIAATGHGAKGCLVACTSSDNDTELEWTAATVNDVVVAEDVICLICKDLSDLDLDEHLGAVGTPGDVCCEEASIYVDAFIVGKATAVADCDDAVASAMSVACKSVFRMKSAVVVCE